MKKFIIAATLILATLLPGCGPLTNPKPAENPNNQDHIEASQSNVFENDYLKITIPEDWTVTTINSNSRAVNITKGKYILYINPYTVQASGAEGGRFAEISMGAPSADAVVLAPPSPPCGTSETHEVDEKFKRVDLFINKNNKSEFCATPENINAWYFSYVTNSQGNYFNYYKDGIHAYVITMAYDSKNIDSFPQKDSLELTTMLNEMSDILKSLELKKQ